MKTLSINAVPQRWAEVLGWIASGDEVQFTSDDKPVARLLPAKDRSPAKPDFLARAKAIWGDQPEGESLSQLVAESR